RHSLAVTDRGALFAWGAAGSGRLGLGPPPPPAVHLQRHPGGEGDTTGSSSSSSTGDPWVEWLPRHVAGTGSHDRSSSRGSASLHGLRVVRVFAGHGATSGCT
ncbi:hypothetical protein Agub_g7419, partial [Astrephomene gubernaculifera]